MFDLLLAGLANIAQVKYLVPLVIGTFVGAIGGALPGVTITMTIIVALPFTFGLDPLQGLAAMVGIYVGGSAGGLVTAILIGIPGTPSAVATTFDGFPMARNGEPGRAIWLGIWASFFGGLIGGLFLIATTGPLAAFALKFGPWEFFSLFVLALSMVAGLVEASLLKGLLAGMLGLIVTVLGNDPMMGGKRLTFGIDFLEGGIDFLPVLIGVFAFAQIMGDIEKGGAARNEKAAAGTGPLRVSQLKVIGEILSRPFLLLWSSIIGVWIGVLPAIGGSAANMMAYDQAKKFSGRPDEFGSGIPEGIIASESSNNANVGGSLVTIMAFGIPGDAVTAVMLGALTIHGIQSGPLFISQQPTLAYGIFAAYLLAHPIMVVIMAICARFALKVLTVPRSMLFPVVLVLCVVGAYALNNTMSNVYVLLVFGVLGYLMVKTGLPLAPFILGVILGDQIEINLIRSIMTDPDPWLFATRPISGLLLAASIVSIGFALWQHWRSVKRREARESAEVEPDF